MTTRRVLIGITGASGAIYAERLLRRLALEESPEAYDEILIVISPAGRRVLAEERDAGSLDGEKSLAAWLGLPPRAARRLRLFPVEDIGAPPATGSFAIEAMAIVPCSMRTLAAVSAGLADNLLTRAADVCLKEGRRLVLAPRESPLNAIHLENMLRLARMGARIVPPMPGFYQNPQTIEEVVDFTVERLVAQIRNSL